MADTLIRDCLENILLNGIKVWELSIPQENIRDGVHLFESDGEVVQAAKSLGIAPGILDHLAVKWLEPSPDGDGLRKALTRAGEVNQIGNLARAVVEASDKLRAVLASETDPERLATILAGLVFLAMGRFSIEVREIYQDVGCTKGSPEQAVSYYAVGVAEGNWELAKRIHTLAAGTEIGRIVTGAMCRRARQLFTLVVAGDRSGLADILAEIFTEVMREGKNDHN